MCIDFYFFKLLSNEFIKAIKFKHIDPLEKRLNFLIEELKEEKENWSRNTSMTIQANFFLFELRGASNLIKMLNWLIFYSELIARGITFESFIGVFHFSTKNTNSKISQWLWWQFYKWINYKKNVSSKIHFLQ